MTPKDQESWLERRSSNSHRQGRARRDDFQRDRARVIHSAAFRRLQSKTQVLGLGESDFYRTRLTHSLEVAQIGSGISSLLREIYADQTELIPWIPDRDLIETICLCHDLGHPPYGHGGEIALNYRMRKSGGFEGNGQTLRTLSTLGEYSKGFGLDLCRRSMLGVIKYPALFEEVQRYPLDALAQDRDVLDVDLEYWRPPKCLFKEESEVFDWILEPFGKSDQELFRAHKMGKGKIGHHRTIHKALDTSIMELADDIAYGIHDLEDAVVLRLVDREVWEQEIVKPLLALPRSGLRHKIDSIGKDLFTPKSFYRKNAIGELVHYFVESVEIQEKDEFAHPLLRHNARFNPVAEAELEFFVRFISKNVIQRPELQALVYKGQHIVLKIFQVLAANPDKLLPANIYEKYQSSSNTDRLICDFVAGMTDSYAERTYKRLFIPGEGSVFDRL